MQRAASRRLLPRLLLALPSSLSLQPHPRLVSSLLERNRLKLSRAFTSVMATTSGNPHEIAEEEYGDDSFWADFDVDAALAAAATSTLKPTTASTPAPPPLKRAKVSPDAAAAGSNNSSPEALQDCLERYFGFRSFREGQLEAIQAVLRGQDVAVFWATGSGKSLCFTLPPLYLNKVALVVSPLISLMQDQVHKLNGLGQGELATFLGSAQTDASQEGRALRGDFRLIYVTPEKLQAPGFLDRMVAANLDLCLVAIDESHCVSDWGHDFRPDYRAVGSIFRNHSQLAQVPLMALTATAVPRIQTDILQTLKLRNVLKCTKTFDRPNLAIKVLPKDGSGDTALRAAMEPLLKSLLQEEQGKSASSRRAGAAVSSTIIYAATKAQVEQVCGFLQQRLQAHKSSVQVEYYHGELSSEQRHKTHVNFLTGRTAIVVATIAFGMGIDKPDTRRVIHFGPPKTVEEYYQQIGRAGRDGLPAECIMYVARSDFDKYQSDFYLGALNEKARQATVQSLQALKNFSLNKETCRRRALLEFFEERPSFGQHCGTCDVCQARQQYGDDATRDFGPIARLVLLSVSKLREQGMTTVLSVLGGKVVEDYRYLPGTDPSQLKAQLETQRLALPIKKITQDQLKDFATALIQSQYISETVKRSQVNGYSRSWTVFSLTHLGTKALNDTNRPIELPVPDCIRQAEKQEEIRKQRVLQQLQDSGIDLEKLPQKEVEDGDGEVIQAYLTWNRRLDTLEKSGKSERLAQVQELLQLVQDWRVDAASRLQMAPASVLPEHVLYAVAYAAQSLPPGLPMSSQDLERSGARNRELQSLAMVINTWLQRYQRVLAVAEATSKVDDPPLKLPRGPIQTTKWAFAVYKPNKKTGLASWESSYLRFAQGESPTSIAIAPMDGGRPVTVTTVLAHIHEAVLQGRVVDLTRLAASSPSAAKHLPTRSEWQQLEAAEKEMGMSVVGDPTASGMNGSKYTMTDMLRPIMGAAFCDTPYNERDEQDKIVFGEWCERLKWYQLLKRAGIPPEF